MSDAETVPVTWAKRNKWIDALSWLPFALVPVLLLASILTHTPYVAVTPHLLIAGLAGKFFLRRKNPAPELVDGTASVKDGVLSFADQRIPIADVTSAVIVPGSTTPTVVIHRRRLGLPVRLVVSSTDEARKVLRMVGFDATQRTLKLRAMSWVMGSALRTFLTIFGGLGAGFAAATIGHAIAPPLVMIAPLIMLAMTATFLIPSNVTVGGDGVLVEWLRWKRFIPIGDIRFGTIYDEGMGRNRRVGVLLTLREGELRIPVGSRWEMESAKALLERIEEVRSAKGAKAIGESAAAEGFLAQIVRTTQSTKEWLAELRAIGTGELATHRVAPVAPETLLRVVEDPGAPPPARVAAAVALKSSGDGDAAKRVRVAAETAAHPKLRVALERSLEEDEDALAEAVDDLQKADA